MEKIKNWFNKVLKRKKEKETTLNLENNILKALIAGLDDGVIGYDSNFKITAFNPAAERIFNLSAAEVLNQTITPATLKNKQLNQLTQVIFPSLAPAIVQISEPNIWPQITELALQNPDRVFRTILIRTVSQNQKAYFLKIVKDRTREKNILKSKSEFISVAAHQLRTPVTAINWVFENLTNIAKEKSLPLETKDLIQQGQEVAQRSLKIINDLLDVAKIEEGRFGYNFEKTNLNQFIQDILINLKPLAEYYGVTLEFKPISQPNEAWIDVIKLNIALSNLIDNAIRYNVKNGRVEISIEKIINQPYLKINIKDTGLGIPETEIDKLFTKFYRGSNVVRIEPNGSGLGLFITKNIIHQHGGEIGVESELNRGSTFYFTLPLDKSLIPTKEVFFEE